MNTSSWIVASFFHLFQQITKQLFFIKIVNILHAHKYVMLYYITTTTELFCEFWESYYTPLNICEWEHVYRSSSAYAKLVSCFLSKQCYYTRYKVKIDENTTTSKFYNLFQYNFCKKKSLGRSREKNCTTVEKRLIGSTAAASLTSDNNKLVVQLKWFFGLMPHYFRCGRLSSVLSIFWQLLSFELILASEIWSFSHSKYAICK